MRRKKGYYYDGHERADVLRERRAFLDELLEFLPRMKHYDEILDVDGKPTGKWTITLPDLSKGIEVILANQDETNGYSGDLSSTIWQEPNRNPGMAKGKGCCLHVSDFVTVDGRLKGIFPAVEEPSAELRRADVPEVRLKELEEQEDPIAKAVLSLLRAGFLWSGSSALVFLGKGWEGLKAHLAEVNNESQDPLHDLDFYIDTRNKTSINSDQFSKLLLQAPAAMMMMMVQP